MSAEGHRCSLLVEDNGITSSANKQRGNPKATKHDTIRYSAASRNVGCRKNPVNRIVDKGATLEESKLNGEWVLVLVIQTKILLWQYREYMSQNNRSPLSRTYICTIITLKNIIKKKPYNFKRK